MLGISIMGKEPIFKQIHDQIIKYIDLEILEEDEKLPSVRKFAIDLGINPNTVAKAYSLLESEGYIYTINKKGAFVNKKRASALDIKIVKDQLKVLKDRGYKANDIIKAIEEVFESEGELNA